MKAKLENQSQTNQINQISQIKAIVLNILSEIGLTPIKIGQLVKQPILEATETLSEDGKWHIARVTTTIIKPKSYVKKVLEG